MTLPDGEGLARAENPTVSSGARSGLQARVVNGALWTVIHTLVSTPIAFVANAIIARYLGVENYGSVAFLTTAVQLAALVGSLGVANTAIQWAAPCYAQQQTGEGDSIIRRAVGVQSLVSAPLCVASVLIFGRAEYAIIASAAVGIVLQTCFGGPALALSAENRAATNARYAMMFNLFTQAASVGVVMMTRSPEALWAVRLVFPGLTAVALARAFQPPRRWLLLLPLYPRALGGSFWSFARYSWIGALIATLVFSRSEILALQGFGFQAALGAFSLAFGLSQQVTAPADSLLGPLIPGASALLAVDEAAAEEALARSIRFASLVAGLILGVLVPVLYELVTAIYGHQFATAASPLLILAAISCLQSSANPAQAFLAARRRADLLLRINLVALLIDLAMMFALIPEFGLWGAVAANVVSQFVGIVLTVRAEASLGSLDTRTLASAFAGFGVGCTALVAAVAASALFGGAEMRAGVAGVAGVVVFLVALRVSRSALTRREGQIIVHAFPGRVAPVVAGLLRPLTNSNERGALK